MRHDTSDSYSEETKEWCWSSGHYFSSSGMSFPPHRRFSGFYLLFVESNYSLRTLQPENLLSYLEKGRLDTTMEISRARPARMDVIEVYLVS